ncbi:YqcC family protein [Vibrio sp. Of7-15]|uniref:YqcC family protein n=1 Tax=Vibrio sp. Of7-15 TaxID=2724879 RepID=UPI001EF2289C|nr:YqcC family protein [Vibrio sp. Of7-15]MCG7498381.1 YqcC family protein [Vibrio sp. Of7-15]
MDTYQHTSLLLDKLEQALIAHDLWQSTSPTKEALASVEPFAVDTLSCTEWLQWIFIPKMRHLVEMKMALPMGFSIAPYVEEALKETVGQQSVLAVVLELDNLSKGVQ